MTKPHKGRWTEGLNAVDVHVTMADGSSVEFKSKKGTKIPPEAMRHSDHPRHSGRRSLGREVPEGWRHAMSAMTAIVAIETLAQQPRDSTECIAARDTVLRFVRDAATELATLRAAVEKAKRYRRHVVRWECLIGGEWYAASRWGCTRQEAWRRARQLWKQDGIRSIHVFAVYRKAKVW